MAGCPGMRLAGAHRALARANHATKPRHAILSVHALSSHDAAAVLRVFDQRKSSAPRRHDGTCPMLRARGPTSRCRQPRAVVPRCASGYDVNACGTWCGRAACRGRATSWHLWSSESQPQCLQLHLRAGEYTYPSAAGHKVWGVGGVSCKELMHPHGQGSNLLGDLLYGQALWLLRPGS